MKRGIRHSDFQKIYDDFHEVRNDEQALVLYLRFLDNYGLDESRPYNVGAQSRLREMALKSPMHLAIKKAYPMFGQNYWDALVTGVQKARGRRVRLNTDHPVKLRLKNIQGKSVNVRLGEGVPVAVESVNQPTKIRLSNPARLRFRNLGRKKIRLFFGGENQ